MRKRSKHHGTQLAASGTGLLVVGLFVWLATAGVVTSIGCLVVGAAMLVLGLIKATTGWNITGHDDPPPPDEYDPREH